MSEHFHLCKTEFINGYWSYIVNISLDIETQNFSFEDKINSYLSLVKIVINLEMSAEDVSTVIYDIVDTIHSLFTQILIDSME